MQPQFFICPRCKQKAMEITKKGNVITNRCNNCKYSHTYEEKGSQPTQKPKPIPQSPQRPIKQRQPRQQPSFDIFDFITSKGIWFLLLTLFILAIINTVNISSVENQSRINEGLLASNIDHNFDCSLANITDIKTTNIQQQTVLDSILASLGTAESEIDVLQGNLSVVGEMQKIIDSFKENLTYMEQKFGNLQNIVNTTTTSVTMTFYLSQNTSTRYAHIDVDVTNNVYDMNELKMQLYYDKTNITLINWNTVIEPLTEQTSSNIIVDWFEKRNNIQASFNMTWSTTDYNTSRLGESNLISNLKVNGIYLDFAPVTVVEVP